LKIKFKQLDIIINFFMASNRAGNRRGGFSRRIWLFPSYLVEISLWVLETGIMDLVQDSQKMQKISRLLPYHDGRDKSKQGNTCNLNKYSFV